MRCSPAQQILGNQLVGGNEVDPRQAEMKSRSRWKIVESAPSRELMPSMTQRDGSRSRLTRVVPSEPEEFFGKSLVSRRTDLPMIARTFSSKLILANGGTIASSGLSETQGYLCGIIFVS